MMGLDPPVSPFLPPAPVSPFFLCPLQLNDCYKLNLAPKMTICLFVPDLVEMIIL